MSRRRPTRALVLVLGLAALLAAPRPGRGQDGDSGDYDPASRAWNGLSTLAGLARGAGYEVATVTGLDWSELGASDLLVLLYPLRRVDPGSLESFIAAGGHVVLADDFGQSADAMGQLSLLRAEVGAADADRFHKGRAFAPIATPQATHPVVDGVTEVVTNHPAVLTRVTGATGVLGFRGQSVVVAGQRGTGRFVVLTDPSIFINRMLEFPGNLRLASNILRWLDRGGRIRRVVLLRGDVPMFGEPQAFIDDAGAGPLGRSIASLNNWLRQRSEWLLTPTAMRVVAAVLAAALVVLVLAAMPPRRARGSDGRWLALTRPGRRDAVDRMVADAEAGRDFLPAATLLRDAAQRALTRATGLDDPLYAVSEAQLTGAVGQARGADAAAALGRVYRRLRALPSRSQAAAPWSATRLAQREFDRLHDDVTELCRTLGEES